MKNILVIGGGAMGSAFTIPSLENKNKVTITEPYSKRFIKDLSSKKKFHSALKIQLPKNLKFRRFSKNLLKENLTFEKYIKDKNILLYIGRLVKRKGIKDLILAWDKLMLKKSDRVLLIVGDDV